MTAEVAIGVVAGTSGWPSVASVTVEPGPYVGRLVVEGEGAGAKGVDEVDGVPGITGPLVVGVVIGVVAGVVTGVVMGVVIGVVIGTVETGVVVTGQLVVVV